MILSKAKTSVTSTVRELRNIQMTTPIFFSFANLSSYYRKKKCKLLWNDLCGLKIAGVKHLQRKAGLKANGSTREEKEKSFQCAHLRRRQSIACGSLKTTMLDLRRDFTLYDILQFLRPNPVNMRSAQSSSFIMRPLCSFFFFCKLFTQAIVVTCQSPQRH